MASLSKAEIDELDRMLANPGGLQKKEIASMFDLTPETVSRHISGKRKLVPDDTHSEWGIAEIHESLLAELASDESTAENGRLIEQNAESLRRDLDLSKEQVLEGRHADFFPLEPCATLVWVDETTRYPQGRLREMPEEGTCPLHLRAMALFRYKCAPSKLRAARQRVHDKLGVVLHISHLCGNDKCGNPNHIAFETTAANMGRRKAREKKA